MSTTKPKNSIGIIPRNYSQPRPTQYSKVFNPSDYMIPKDILDKYDFRLVRDVLSLDWLLVWNYNSPSHYQNVFEGGSANKVWVTAHRREVYNLHSLASADYSNSWATADSEDVSIEAFNEINSAVTAANGLSVTRLDTSTVAFDVYSENLALVMIQISKGLFIWAIVDTRTRIGIIHRTPAVSSPSIWGSIVKTIIDVIKLIRAIVNEDLIGFSLTTKDLVQTWQGYTNAEIRAAVAQGRISNAVHLAMLSHPISKDGKPLYGKSAGTTDIVFAIALAALK